MAVIGRPPLLGVGHQRIEILFQGLIVELFEFLGIVEFLAHGIALAGMLVENLQVQLVRPPVPVGCAAAGSGIACFARYRALACFIRHVALLAFRFLERKYYMIIIIN